jgi:hypothetical protein
MEVPAACAWCSLAWQAAVHRLELERAAYVAAARQQAAAEVGAANCSFRRSLKHISFAECFIYSSCNRSGLGAGLGRGKGGLGAG